MNYQTRLKRLGKKPSRPFGMDESSNIIIQGKKSASLVVYTEFALNLQVNDKVWIPYIELDFDEPSDYVHHAEYPVWLDYIDEGYKGNNEYSSSYHASQNDLYQGTMGMVFRITQRKWMGSYLYIDAEFAADD